MEVYAFTSGRGRLSCRFHGYAPCDNEQEVIESCGYEPEHDLDNPADSVFCAHGAGVVVPWQQVDEYAHVDTGDKLRRLLPEIFGAAEEEGDSGIPGDTGYRTDGRRTAPVGSNDRFISQEEIEEIYLRTYGTRALDINPWNRNAATGGKTVS